MKGYVTSGSNIGFVKPGTSGRIARGPRPQLGNGRFGGLREDNERGQEFGYPLEVRFEGSDVLVPVESHEVGL